MLNESVFEHPSSSFAFSSPWVSLLAPNSPIPETNQRGLDLIIQVSEGQAAKMNRVGGSGINSADVPPPQRQQMEGMMGFTDSMLMALRDNYRERMIEYAGQRMIDIWMVVPADWWRRLPNVVRRLEKVLFDTHPNKREYYSMTRGAVKPHFEYALKTLFAQSQEQQRRNQQTSTQRASSSTQGEATNQDVNTVLSLVMNTPETTGVFATPAPGKEVRKEPKFSCPVCMNELVNASSTSCGHIFCHKCIKASIQAQQKCPICRKTLTMNNFHPVYLPMMD